MDLKKLKNVFPGSYISKVKVEGGRLISLPLGDQWLVVEKAALTDREWILVSNLLGENQTNTQSSWQSFLFAGGSLPESETSHLRLVQMTLDLKDSTVNRDFWLDSVFHLFPQVKDLFFQTDQSFYIIQSKPKSLIDDLLIAEGLIKTLEEDFKVKITAYFGQYWPLESQLLELWQEELSIFNSQNHQIKGRVGNLPTLALGYYTEFSRKNSYILSQLNQLIADDLQWFDIIDSLWKNQLNITETAKALYIHRNTLQYRIDRFQEETGLSLRKVDDLTLANIVRLTKN